MMTKSERLLFLIRLMRDHKGVSLQEMSVRCGVSHRTLYRDFRALSRLNYPIRYDNGYRLSRGTLPAPIGISADEIQLVRFALRLAPLTRYPWLRRQIFAIDTKLAVSVSEQTNSALGTQLGLDDEFRLLSEIPCQNLVEQFLKAMQRKKRVVLIRSGEPASPPLVPVSLRVTPVGLFLALSNPGEVKPTEIDVTRLSGIRTVPK
jgi:hypothetical protein